MAIRISGTTGIDMGNTSVSNASQVELQEEQVTPFSGFKNYIINGGFDVWQRGTSGVAAGFKADRWQDLYGGATQSWSRSTDVPSGSGAKYSIKYNGGNSLLYFTEAEVSKSLKGKTAVISCWMKTSTVINGISIQKQNVFEGGLTGGYSHIAGVVMEYISSHTGDGTWQKVVTRYTFPNTSEMDNGLCIINIATSYGTDSFATQVQLEEGSVATPFENRPYGLELSLCQRYYETGHFHGVSYGSSAAAYQRTQAFYKCNKRIAPSVTLSKIAGDATGMDVTLGTTSHLTCGFSSTGASQEWYGTYTASAEL